MGVPKFFRWISERYPKINQAIHAPPNPETQREYFPSISVSTDNDNADNSKSKQDSKMYILKNSIIPEFDRLYLDMNGIIHCCSHNNAGDDTATPDPDTHMETEGIPPSLDENNNNDANADAPGTVQITEEEIFRNVCYYIDRIVTDIVKPNELVYMAIDGVAPRAKMNQQRSRRYRSGKEKEIEKTFYAASLLKQRKELEQAQQQEHQMFDDSNSGSHNDDFNFVNMDGEYEYNYDNVSRADRSSSKRSSSSRNSTKIDKFDDDEFTPAGDVKEVEPGRFTGKFETSGKEKLSSSGNSGLSTLSTSSPNSSSGSTANSSSTPELFDKDYEDFIASIQSSKSIDEEAEISSSFHSNSITPGTPFFERCTEHIQEFIKRKIHSDPRWAHLTIIFSGPRTPGEGEHKIMDFIRTQKNKKDYNPNTRHCLFGQDGDLIMLGLATHEPHFALLREEVVFDQKRRERSLDLLKAAKLKSLEQEAAALAASIDDGSGTSGQDMPPISNEELSVSIDSYMHNSNFELLHMSILRDYLAYEFETKDVVPTSPFELEQTIDDFVFMTFFVGNDFLPHMPAIDIADEAFDLLFYVYKRNRWKWLKGSKGKIKSYPYLTRSGEIVSGHRLEMFLSYLGKHEDPYYDNKQRTFAAQNEMDRKADEKAGRDSMIPTEEILAAKEEWERTEYKEMLKSIAIQQQEISTSSSGFTPVATERGIFDELELNQNSNNKGFEFNPESTGDELDEGFLSRMGTLFRYSLSNSDDEIENAGSKADLSAQKEDAFDDFAQDLKARYYFDKFKFSPLDAEKHIALRKAYIEGLLWNLQYYYKGCVSWDWYYPYHYGPMLSDLKDIDKLLKQISFKEDKSEPLLPFEQLMANLPPSSAELLPNPYQWLMKSAKSPIVDFYPESFTIDMNGKRWPWEAVVLLPFIDSERLIHASRSLVQSDQLTDKERSRNCVEDSLIYTRNQTVSKDAPVLQDKNLEVSMEYDVQEQSCSLTQWKHSSNGGDVFHPELLPGTIVPYPGFPSLKDAPVQALKKRKLGINVFGRRSRYKTAVLVMNSDIPMIASAEALAEKFIGTTLHFRYPFLQEGFVTALSDAEMTIRGKEAPRQWNPKEAQIWKLKNDTIHRQYVAGQGLTGTGGWDIPESSVTLSIRPFKEFQTLPDGRKVKVYARLEVEVPFIAALWSPSRPDPRFSNLPVRIEKNPYRFGSDPISPSLGIKTLTKSRKGKKSSASLFPSTKGLSGTNKNVTATASSILPPLQNNVKGYCTLPVHRYQKSSTITESILLQRSRRPMKVPSMKSKSIGVVAAVAAAILSKGVNSELLSSYSLRHKCLHNKIFMPRGGGLHNENTIFDENQAEAESDSVPPLEFAHGTTTLSFTFDGGIVAAVDSRASIGNFVGSKTTQKVLPITDHIIGTMAGGAADCSFWIRRLQAESRHYELSEGRPISVARVARVLADYLYENRGFDLSIGTMIMGFDEYGPSIYYVDNSGSRLKGDLFSVGSGSTFALGVLDTERRRNMKEEEAVALGIKAIRHATFRDAFSGGYIAVYVIRETGWKKVFSEDLALVDKN